MTKHRSGPQRTKIDRNRPKMTTMVDQCLTHQIVARIVEDEPGFQDQVEELEWTVHADGNWGMYLKVIVGIKLRLQDSQHSNCEKG